MMADELNIHKGLFIKSFMKICGRGRSAQSSSHTDLWMSKSNADLHYAKASFRLVKTIPVFFIAFFSFLR
jgi:hypothetical protein